MVEDSWEPQACYFYQKFLSQIHSLSLSPPSSVQNSYLATPKIKKSRSKCIVYFFTIIKCLDILWKLFSEIYFKIPSVFILKLEFPALHREWHKSGRSCICKWKMPQGLHLSFFHSFKFKINLTKNGTACCIYPNGKCLWRRGQSISNKKIQKHVFCKWSISFRWYSSLLRGWYRITFFANPDRLVDWKDANFLQIGCSIAKRTVWNHTFCMKSETMLKCCLLFVKLC